MQPVDNLTSEQIRGMSVIQLRHAIKDDPRMANLMDVYDRARLQDGIIAAKAVSPAPAPSSPAKGGNGKANAPARKAPAAPAETEATPNVAPVPGDTTESAEFTADSTDPVIAAAFRPPVAPAARGKGFPHKAR